jgi:hypothetical protein
MEINEKPVELTPKQKAKVVEKAREKLAKTMAKGKKAKKLKPTQKSIDSKPELF